MRTGFQILRTRRIDEFYSLDDLETKFSVQFPPIFTLFMETFELSLLPSKKFIAYFPDEEVGFAEFNSDMHKNISVYLSEPSYCEKGMLPIASSGIHSGGICIGLHGSERDKIFLSEPARMKYRLLDDNIFEFVRGLIEVEDGEDSSIYTTPPKNRPFNDAFSWADFIGILDALQIASRQGYGKKKLTEILEKLTQNTPVSIEKYGSIIVISSKEDLQKVVNSYDSNINVSDYI